MTWKEFKQQVEAQGLTDDHEIGWIDFSQDFPDVQFSKKRLYATVAGRFETVDEEDARLERERKLNDDQSGRSQDT